MKKTYKNSLKYKVPTISGCTLLVALALLHGSGLFYVTDLVQNSNSDSLIKQIFPVLFIFPSIELLGLAALSIFTFFMQREGKTVLLFITTMVFVNALLAFYLGAWLPGFLLVLAASLFFFASVQKTNTIAP